MSRNNNNYASHQRNGTGHKNNDQKKRDRSGTNTNAWSVYYASRRKEKKDDRHGELDSSAAVAINAGTQPTLAKRRRQLANDKWEPASQNSDVEKIFWDLIDAHTKKKQRDGRVVNNNNTKITSNPIVMNARKSFWRRKLLVSSKYFDGVWKEARNNFLWHIAHARRNGTNASTSASAPGLSRENRSNGRQHPPPSGGTDRSTKESSVGGTTTGSSKPAGKGARSTQSKTVVPSGDDNNSVIDLCDSSDSENEDEKENQHQKDKNEHEHAENAISDASRLKHTQSALDEIVAKIRREKEERNKSDGGDNRAAERGTKEQSREVPTERVAAMDSTEAPVEPAAVTVPGAVMDDIPAAPKEVEPPLTENRWSKFFLGPDFQSDIIFSLEECEF